MINPLAVVAQESRDLKSLSIQKSPLDSDLIAIPKRAETIHRAFGKAFCDLIVGVNGWPYHAEHTQIRPNRNRIRTIINIVPTMPEGP